MIAAVAVTVMSFWDLLLCHHKNGLYVNKVYTDKQCWQEIMYMPVQRLYSRVLWQGPV